MINVTVDPDVTQRWRGNAILGVVEVRNLKNTKTPHPRIDERLTSYVSYLQVQGITVLDERAVQQMRATFRAMPDMDPSRYRPSSESLIRRCLTKDIARINPIVDLNNVLSMTFRIPLGVYDARRLHPFCTYRIGHEGETYTTISQAPKNAEGKLVLADPAGVVGSPVTDSGRALVESATNHVVVIAYIPFETSMTDAEQICEAIEVAYVREFDGEPVQREIVETMRA